MKRLLFRIRNGGMIAIIAVLGSFLSSGAFAQDDPAGRNNASSSAVTGDTHSADTDAPRGRDLVPRLKSIKPERTMRTAGDDASRIEVKFVDGLRFDINPRGMLIERAGRELWSPQSRTTLQRFERARGVWHRMVTVGEEAVDRMRGNAQRKLGKEVADMNSYYILTVPEGADAASWIDQLNALPEVQIARFVPLPAPMPVPGDFQDDQEYLDAATDGVDAESYAWGISGGTGANVRIVDLEYSWNLNHQDLPAGITTLIPGGRTAVDPFNDNNHGTAVLGELASINNGWGTTGVAHAAQIFVAPVSWDNGYNLAAAIINAIPSLSAGDIMLIEQQTRGPNYVASNAPSQFGLVPSEWQEAVYDAIVTAVGNGIHVVEAAGNGSQDLDAAEYSAGNGGHYPFNGTKNSGAIIVGAGARPSGSTTDRSRLGFSCYGSRVNVQGWGEGVMTTGYGTFYNTEGVNLWYRSTFGGTSSASPIVTGAVALIESIQQQVNSSNVTPGAMRTLLINTGSPQLAGANPVSENIGPRPSIRAAIQSLDPCDLTCPADITVSNDADLCGAVVTFPAASTSATCGPVTFTPASGSFFPVGTTTVTVSTTSGSSCTFDVTVNDTQDPSITCPTDITVDNDPGDCGAIVTYAATASDNCPGVTMAYNPPSGSFFPVGTTSVTVTATDAHSNDSQCSFDVTVDDAEAPTISVTLSPTMLWPPNHMMRNISATVTAADNCPGVTYAVTSITSN
ncbi:MAG: S8 family serine peptidase, partial [Bacteroidetes bacterium]|nr:S8 family serine peptidase [Bacteroidota bacterium]